MNLEIIQVGTNPYLGEFIRVLRNSSEYRDVFINNTFITPEMQRNYMREHGKDYYVCINKTTKEKLGYIGIVDNDIRLAIRLEYKRQGIGTFMLDFIKTKYPDFQVKIRKSNIESQKFFDKNNIKYRLVD